MKRCQRCKIYEAARGQSCCEKCIACVETQRRLNEMPGGTDKKSGREERRDERQQRRVSASQQ